jgi:hypothetical protein
MVTSSTIIVGLAAEAPGIVGVDRVAVFVGSPLAIHFNVEIDDQVGAVRVVTIEEATR